MNILKKNMKNFKNSFEHNFFFSKRNFEKQNAQKFQKKKL